MVGDYYRFVCFGQFFALLTLDPMYRDPLTHSDVSNYIIARNRLTTAGFPKQ